MTTKFINNYQQGDDGYITFASIFSAKGKIQRTNKTSNLLDNYKRINILLSNNTYQEISPFCKLTKTFISDVSINKNIGEPNQKWHLLVSFYGQNAVEGTLSKSNIFKKSITCPELWLWMLEAAIDDSNITKDDVKALYTQACKYKNKLITKKEWQAFFSSYWSKLIDAITT